MTGETEAADRATLINEATIRAGLAYDELATRLPVKAVETEAELDKVRADVARTLTSLDRPARDALLFALVLERLVCDGDVSIRPELFASVLRAKTRAR